MKFTHTTKTALKGLWAHKSRSALTILGIVIGIASIILIASIGKGAQNLIVGQIQSLGSNIIAVVPGREPKGPTDPASAESFFSDSIKQRELDALLKKTNAPDITRIVPAVFGIETASYLGETFRPTIFGSSEDIVEFFDIETENGRFYSKNEVESKSNVVIIGSEVKEELFGDSDAVGKNIRVKDKNLRVIGVLPKRGQILFINFDETIFTPYTTAQQYIFGIKYFNRLIVQVDNEESVPRTVEDIEITLRGLHNITDPDNDDFFVATQEEISETLSSVLGSVTLFLGVVAAIALLVGGIGIMNIMLVSVTERTKEIGLRKAIGATKNNILTQFMLESVILTGLGGLLGVLFGIGLSILVSILLSSMLEINWTFTFPVSAAVIGIVVSTLVGLVFGIYPALKAAKKDPIQALNYE